MQESPESMARMLFNIWYVRTAGFSFSTASLEFGDSNMERGKPKTYSSSMQFGKF